MSELRQNIATKEWYVIATERARRPGDFKKAERCRENVEYSEKCPFCPGNEVNTPFCQYEIVENGKWQVRSVPNKFSAFSPVGDRERHIDGIYRSMQGVGLHEVIVESRIHNDFYTKMSEEHIQKIIKVYLHRFKASMEDERIETVIIFKNYGISAGSSQAHPHSQMIAVPLVPSHIRHRLDVAKRYCDDTGKCVFCVMMEEEKKSSSRVITENNSFVVFCPYASGSPFESWIMPKQHNPSFGDTSDNEIKDLANIIKDLFSRYYYGLGDPDFNFAIRTPPKDESNDRSFHWYIKVMPKVTQIAGFELGTGMFINVTLPEESAAYLREIKIRN